MLHVARAASRLIGVVLLLGCLLVCSSTVLCAQDFRPARPGPSGLSADVRRPGRRVEFVQFEDRDITEVMKVLADFGDWTIICSPAVRGKKVTLFVKDIAPETLLDRVVAVAGLEYVKEGNVVVVLDRDEYARVYGLEKVIRPLHHAKAEDLLEYLRGFLTKGGQIAADTRTNQLVLVDTPASLRELLRAVDTLDAEVVTQVVPLHFADASETAATLQSMVSLPVHVEADTRTNQLVIEGPPEVVARALPVVQALDREDIFSTRVFQLKHADCLDVAQLIQEMLGRPAAAAYGLERRRQPTPARRGPEARPTRGPALRTQFRGTPSAGTLREQALRRAAAQARERAAAAERPPAPSPVSPAAPREAAPPSAEAEVGIGVVGTVVADERTNSVIVTEAPIVLQRIEEVVEQIDIELALHSYRLNYADPEELGLEGKLAQILDAETDRFEIDPRTRLVTFRTSPTKAQRVKDLLTHWDEPARQVFIEAEVLAVSLNRLKEIGLDLEALFSPDFGVRTQFPPSFLPPPGGTVTIADLETSGFHGVIDLLERKGVAKLLSSPRILVKHEQVAAFSVSTAEPYTEVVIDAAAQITSENVQFVDVGITLTVLPRINEEDVIDMDVALEASQLIEIREGVPVVDRSIAQSTILVKDGHTVAMGGLIINNRIKSVDKVPLLGDIPLLGGIFRRTRVTNDRSQLLLLITPHIVSLAPTKPTPTVDELYEQTMRPQFKQPVIELLP